MSRPGPSLACSVLATGRMPYGDGKAYLASSRLDVCEGLFLITVLGLRRSDLKPGSGRQRFRI
jgi:hypothetical protein